MEGEGDVCHRAWADVRRCRDWLSFHPVFGIELRSLRLRASALTHVWSQLGPYSSFSFSVDTAIAQRWCCEKGAGSRHGEHHPFCTSPWLKLEQLGLHSSATVTSVSHPGSNNWQWKLGGCVTEFWLFYSFNTDLFIVRVDLSIYYKLLFNSLLQSFLFWDYRCVTLCPASKLVLYTLFRTCLSWIPQWLF